MAERNMPEFRRKPAAKMLVAEVKETTYTLPKSGEDTYESQSFLTPTGEVVSKVVVCGTAIEKEDVGRDQPFWRMRVADPTGGMAVFAGQYQAEAAQTIAGLEIPCHVMVVGKLSIYQPENGNKIISIRPDRISIIKQEDRDAFLLDAAEQLAARLKAPKNAERTKEVYPSWDSKVLAKCAADALRGLIEPGVEQPAQPPAPPAQVEAPAAPPAAPPTVQTPAAEKPTKTPAEKKKVKKEEKTPEVPPATGAFVDGKDLILEIIKSQQKGCQYEKLFASLKEKGRAMMDVDSAIKKLMDEGLIYEPKIGVLRATP